METFYARRRSSPTPPFVQRPRSLPSRALGSSDEARTFPSSLDACINQSSVNAKYSNYKPIAFHSTGASQKLERPSVSYGSNGIARSNDSVATRRQNQSQGFQQKCEHKFQNRENSTAKTGLNQGARWFDTELVTLAYEIAKVAATTTATTRRKCSSLILWRPKYSVEYQMRLNQKEDGGEKPDESSSALASWLVGAGVSVDTLEVRARRALRLYKGRSDLFYLFLYMSQR